MAATSKSFYSIREANNFNKQNIDTKKLLKLKNFKLVNKINDVQLDSIDKSYGCLSLDSNKMKYRLKNITGDQKNFFKNNEQQKKSESQMNPRKKFMKKNHNLQNDILDYSKHYSRDSMNMTAKSKKDENYFVKTGFSKKIHSNLQNEVISKSNAFNRFSDELQSKFKSSLKSTIHFNETLFNSQNVSRHQSTNNIPIHHHESCQFTKKYVVDEFKNDYKDSVKMIDNANVIHVPKVQTDDNISQENITKQMFENSKFKQYPFYELHDGIPKSIDFLISNGTYIFIDCHKKRFPAKIIVDDKKTEFEFFVKFDNKADPKFMFTKKEKATKKFWQEIAHKRQQHQNTTVNESSFQYSTPNKNMSSTEYGHKTSNTKLHQQNLQMKNYSANANIFQSSKVQFETLVKPSNTFFDLSQKGNCIIDIEIPDLQTLKRNAILQKHEEHSKDLDVVDYQNEDQDYTAKNNEKNSKGEHSYNYMVILIICKKPTRASFSISFTNNKVVHKFKNHMSDAFDHKELQNLFGDNILQYKDEIKIIKDKKKIGQNHVLQNNMVIAENYRLHKVNNIELSLNKLNDRQNHAANKMRIMYRENIDRKLIFQQSNARLKEESRLSEERQINNLIIYCQKYSWTVLLGFYKLMIVTKYMLTKARKQSDYDMKLRTAASTIQRKYRKKFTHRHDSTCGKFRSNLIILKSAQNLRAGFVFPLYHTDAKNCTGTFFRKICKVKRQLHYTQDFILMIKRIQRRFRKHIQVRNQSIENIEQEWTKQVIKLAENEKYYKDIGLNYDLDNQSLITPEVRREMVTQQVDIQLLRYVDQKFTNMKKKKIKSVKVLNTPSQDIDKVNEKMQEKETNLQQDTIHEQKIKDGKFILNDSISHRSLKQSIKEVGSKIGLIQTPKKDIQENKRVEDLDSKKISLLFKKPIKTHQSGVLPREGILTEDVEEDDKASNQCSRSDSEGNERVEPKEVQEKPKLSNDFLMLFVNVAKYVFESTYMWKKLYDSTIYGLYQNAQQKAPEIVKLENAYQEKQKLKLLLAHKSTMDLKEFSPLKKGKKNRGRAMGIPKKDQSKEISLVLDQEMPNEFNEHENKLMGLLPMIDTNDKFTISYDHILIRAIIISTLEREKRMSSQQINSPIKSNKSELLSKV